MSTEQPYYAESAYDGRRERASGTPAHGGYAQRPRAKTGLPGGVHCREFLAIAELYAITFLNSDSAALRRQLALPVQERLRWESTANPAAVVRAFTTALGWMAVITAFAMVLSFFATGVSLSDILSALGVATVPTALFGCGRFLLAHKLIPDKNNIVFNRRTGLVTVPVKGRRHVLPFAECNGYLRTEMSVTGGIEYYLVIAHPRGVAAVNPRHRTERWLILQDWEYLQAYMDTSRPLPDVAELEGYRARDPVSAEYDRRVGRPADFWKSMPRARAAALRKASLRAAKAYPWGLTREAALARGWRPSPGGEGWPVAETAGNGEVAAE